MTDLTVEFGLPLVYSQCNAQKHLKIQFYHLTKINYHPNTCHTPIQSNPPTTATTTPLVHVAVVNFFNEKKYHSEMLNRFWEEDEMILECKKCVRFLVEK